MITENNIVCQEGADRPPLEHVTDENVLLAALPIKGITRRDYEEIMKIMDECDDGIE